MTGVTAVVSSAKRMMKPSRKDPVTLMTKVPRGKASPTFCWIAAPTKRRIRLPIAPPMSTAIATLNCGMHVRLAVEADIPQLLPLMRGLAEFENTIADFALTEEVLLEHAFRRSPPDCTVLVAVDDDGGLLGMIVYFLIRFSVTTKPEMILKDVFVAREARGRGIGEHLLRAAAREALRLNVSRVDWQVAQWNTEAKRFYERLGAQSDPVWVNYGLTLDACRALADGLD